MTKKSRRLRKEGGECRLFRTGNPRIWGGTDLTSGLFAGSPGTTAGPLAPPRSTPSRVSSRSSPLIFFASAPWHE